MFILWIRPLRKIVKRRVRIIFFSQNGSKISWKLLFLFYGFFFFSFFLFINLLLLFILYIIYLLRFWLFFSTNSRLPRCCFFHFLLSLHRFSHLFFRHILFIIHSIFFNTFYFGSWWWCSFLWGSFFGLRSALTSLLSVNIEHIIVHWRQYW